MAVFRFVSQISARGAGTGVYSCEGLPHNGISCDGMSHDGVPRDGLPHKVRGIVNTPPPDEMDTYSRP